jgi:hypothetical protein
MHLTIIQNSQLRGYVPLPPFPVCERDVSTSSSITYPNQQTLAPKLITEIFLMDPFTISTGLAGFLSLALEIIKILSTYISAIKSAPEDANNFLLEVTALRHVLDQLVKFPRTDVKRDFASTSALYVAIMACQQYIEDLYKKLEKLQYRNDNNRVKGIV